MEAPVLAQPDLKKVFILQTDASNEGLGAVFTQKDDQDAEHPIAFANRKLSDLELKYTTTEKECLAIVLALEHFNTYCEGHKYTILTDHQALTFLKRSPHTNIRF